MVENIDENEFSRPYYTEEHVMFKQSLRKYLEKEAVPNYDKWEEEGMLSREFWKMTGEKGYICAWVDEAYGGLGLDFGFTAILNEELARIGAGISSGIGTHSSVIVPYIASYGTKQQKEKYLPKCVSGELITAIAMTEPGAGSDLANITTTAIKKGDHYIVNGQKTFITNGIQSDLLILAVKTDPNAQPKHRGVSLLLVDSDTPGFSRGRKLKKVGMHSQDTAELIFQDMKVPINNLLGEEGKGFKYLMNQLQQERLIACINAQAAAEDMLNLTLAYVKERKAFGQSISKFQHTQFVLAELATEIQISRTYIDDLIMKFINGVNIETQVSMGKWWIADMTKKVADKCVQLHGGYGYMEEYKIAKRFRDTPVLSIFGGSNEIMKVIISRKLGL